LALTDKASDAFEIITSGLTAWRSPLARAFAEVGQFDDAWCCIDEAIMAVETTTERLWEAEVNRIARLNRAQVARA